MPDYTPQSWVTGSKFEADQATEMSHQLDEEEEINVTQAAAIAALQGQVGSGPQRSVAAPTGLATTDTAAIMAAHNLLPPDGGTLWLREGEYALSATPPVFTKQEALLGQGCARPDNRAPTALIANSATATGITCNVEGCYLDGFALLNNFVGTVTSGVGIRMQKGHQAALGPRLRVWNFFDNIVFESGNYWAAMLAHNYSPWRYGLVIRNSDHADSGDNVIGGWFDMPGVTRNAAAAIRWETSGGFRFTGKINAVGSNKFGIGIDFAFNGSTFDTADLFITPGSSIENCLNTAVKLSRTSGSHIVVLAQILGLEIMNTPIGIQVGPGFEDVLIDHITAFGLTTGVDILNGATKVTVGNNNRWRAVTEPVHIAAGATEVRLKQQERSTPVAGIVFTDATATGVGGTTNVDYDYARNLDFGVTATPKEIFKCTVDNFTSGTITVEAAGVHIGTSGFTTARVVRWLVDATGGVTITDKIAEDYSGSIGAGRPRITFVTAANSISVRIATADGAGVASAIAYFSAKGHLGQLQIGSGT
jgi:hypothetical protein